MVTRPEALMKKSLLFHHPSGHLGRYYGNLASINILWDADPPFGRRNALWH
jgi:hypothetical protein